MIKSKGVCDICQKEFEIGNGCFAVQFNHDKGVLEMKIWTDLLTSPREDWIVDICGKECLYRHLERCFESVRQI